MSRRLKWARPCATSLCRAQIFGARGRDVSGAIYSRPYTAAPWALRRAKRKREITSPARTRRAPIRNRAFAPIRCTRAPSQQACTAPIAVSQTFYVNIIRVRERSPAGDPGRRVAEIGRGGGLARAHLEDWQLRDWLACLRSVRDPANTAAAEAARTQEAPP